MVAVVLLAFTGTTSARQQVLFEVGGDHVDDQLGRVVSGAGDVNADGFADFMAGSHLSDRNGRNSGVVLVFSGENATILHSYVGGTGLGFAISGSGDVNNDGYDDFVMSDPFQDVLVGGVFGGLRTSAGTADVRSGRDGSRLYLFKGSLTGEGVGWALSGAGDVDNDGFCDIFVGALEGTAWVRSGATGAVLYTFVALPGGNGPGTAVSDAGDVNGDGHDDLLAGDFNYQSERGLVQVFSGLDGTELIRIVGASAGLGLGFSVGGAGDVNADGVPDVIAGEGGGSSTSAARVYSGVDGSELHVFSETNMNIGPAVDGAGDLDNDGHDDLVLGGPAAHIDGYPRGRAWARSGKDGSVLFMFSGTASSRRVGESVSGVGDVDGDGFSEVIIGIPVTSFLAPNGGKAIVVSGDECGSIRSLGAGCVGTGGFTLALSLTGCLVLGEPLEFEIQDGPGGAPVALLVSGTSGTTTFANGCPLELALPATLVPLGLLSSGGPGDGQITLGATVTGVPGATYYLGAVIQDGDQTITSNTLELQVTP